MKTDPIKTWRVRIGAVAGAALWMMAAAASADDMQQVYQQGRALFYQGRFAEAKPLLEQVAAANPRHPDTQAMLARIKLMAKQGPTLQEKYQAVKIPRIEFQDVNLPDALEGLKILAKDASGGKVTPNFLVQNPEVMTQTFSLHLADVPLTEALKFATDLAGAAMRYEKHAVYFSTRSEARQSTAATE